MTVIYENIDQLNQAFDCAMANIDWYTEGVNILKPINMIYKITREYLDGFANLSKLKEESEYVEKAYDAILRLNTIPEFRNMKYKIFVGKLDIGEGPDNCSFKKISKSEERLLAQNMARAILSRKKKDINEIMDMFYSQWGKPEEAFYLIPGSSLEKLLRMFMSDYKSYVLYAKDLLKDVTTMIQRAKENDYSIIEDFKTFCKGIQKAITRRYEIMVSNQYAIRFGVTKTIKDFIRLKSKNVKDIKFFYDGTEKPFSELTKTYKYYDDIKIGDVTFKIYKSPYSDISTCISKDLSIIVGNNFFKMSPPIQEAVILHEMGHYFRGHFDGVGLQDERKFEKFIKKKRKEFVRYLRKEGFYFKNQHDVNQTVASILHELDADTYAANAIGKKLIRDALKKRNLEDIKLRRDLSDNEKRLTYMLLRVRAKMIK